MTKAEQIALEEFPLEAFPKEIGDSMRLACKIGYLRAEEELALTLEDIVRLDRIIMNMVGEGYNDGYKTRPFYEEVLRRFNEQYRKK